MNKNLTKAQRKFIKENYQDLSIEQIAQRLNIKPEEVQQSIKDLGLRLAPQGPRLKKIDEFLNSYAVWIISIAAILYVLFFSVICIMRYNAFNYADFDLGIYGQAMWNITHGSLESSILGIPFLGNHLDLLLFLIAPFYFVFSTPIALLLLQTLFLGLGAIPVYLLAKSVLDRKFALLFCLLYLAYPALHFVNSYEFHPVAFSTFFLLFMFYFFEKEKFTPFVCFMVLSQLCKENISLGILFFSLYVAFFRKRSWRWSVVPLASSILWLIFGMKLMNFYNRGTIDFNFIYSHIGKNLPEVAINIFRYPGTTIRYILTKANAKFLLQMFLPLAFLSLLSPKILFISIPFFMQQLLSIRIEDHTIEYHYTAKLIPFLFIAAVYGVRLLLKSEFMRRHNLPFMGIVLSFAVASNLSFGLFPKIPNYISSRYSMEDLDYAKQDFINKIPQDSSVVTTFEFLPKLSQRKGIYSFHHVYIGQYTLSTKRNYILPPEVKYALIDFDDYLMFTSFYLPSQYPNLQNFFLKDNWSLIAAVDNVGLFEKKDKRNLGICEASEKDASLGNTKLIIEENIAANGYQIENNKLKSGQNIHLSFTWECLRQTNKDYWIAFKVVDKDGRLLHSFNHPICYRIYPTYSWKEKDYFKEDIWILLPSKVKAREAWLKMIVFDRGTAGLKGGTAKSVPVRSNMYGIFDSEGWINLGKVYIE